MAGATKTLRVDDRVSIACMHNFALGDRPAAPRAAPRAAVVVAHSSPVVSLGLVRILNDRRSDVVRVHESGFVADEDTDALLSQACLTIGDDAGIRRQMGAREASEARIGLRLVIVSSGRARPQGIGTDNWISIDCHEDELLGSVDRLLATGSGSHRMSGRPFPSPVDADRGLTPDVRRRILEHIDSHLAEQFEMQTLADMAGLSVGHFARAFRQSLGSPPHRFLMHRRIERAVALVRDTKPSLIEIAMEVGFSDQSHFTRLFGKVMGETPSACRFRHLQGRSDGVRDSSSRSG